MPLDSFDIVEIELASGRAHSLILKDKVRVKLLGEEGRALSGTSAYLVVDENLEEPLVKGSTIDKLGMVVLSFKRGFVGACWRVTSCC